MKSAGVPVIATTDEAEGVARKWMKQRYSNKISKIKFNHVALQDGVWMLKAEVEVRAGVLSTSLRSLDIKVDSSTMGIVGYSEEAVKE